MAQRPPAPVRGAFALWITAVVAGVLETALAVGGLLSGDPGSAGQVAVGLAIRVPVFVAALVVAVHMLRGRGWARTALTLGLGVLGTASMVVPPLTALAKGSSLGAFLADAGPRDLAFGAIRALHVAAVLTAVLLMFVPAANAYFRARRTR
ncbi:hypothetical protein [Streptoalloteichus tenebrarius]|uniref:hypothetical protein n=1 Tax=Streptoalloteichus tenebrarius (strain ATCC 17920 / DSM 40477 / JCM 4838 / CBS 697.72 / NBRC 16177 / NCIMB 11028 / NRRL B-12390 / A12253. 1 / ISP 5477) TaxID=1933 RepID=UPI0020A35D94|nr:hypothetical protein [Streptoalloteichus tenebrarius]